MRSALLGELGEEAGCQRLAAAFYARVAAEPVLRPLFPGKSMRCATEEFAAFLAQFLEGDEAQTQKRWWLSLRESHARFRIGEAERGAWLRCMRATLEAAPLADGTRRALWGFFEQGSAYVRGGEGGAVEDAELGARWREQLALDDAVGAIAAGREEEALALAPRFADRPAVFVGLLARMAGSGRAAWVRFVVRAVEGDPGLQARRFGGRTLLHFAAGAGCLEVVEALLRVGAEAEEQDAGGHTALYRVANECGSAAGAEVVRVLARAGADVRAAGGVTRATPLHMAARRGHVEIARALIECGAEVEARDRKGDTPLRRALNCRKEEVARLLRERGARG